MRPVAYRLQKVGVRQEEGGYTTAIYCTCTGIPIKMLMDVIVTIVSNFGYLSSTVELLLF